MQPYFGELLNFFVPQFPLWKTVLFKKLHALFVVVLVAINLISLRKECMLPHSESREALDVQDRRISKLVVK